MVLNNYSEIEMQHAKHALPHLFNVFFFSQEIGESGTPHLQGYGETLHPTTIAGLQKKITSAQANQKSRWAVKIAVADRRANYQYCTKTSELTFSKPPSYEELFATVNPAHNSARSQRKMELIQQIREGSTVPEVARSYPDIYLQNASGIDKLSAHFQSKRQHMTIGYWLSGPTGAGKSRWAFENFPDAYYKDPETDWWDGYHGQETVIVDDYRPTKALSFAKLLRIVDRYPLVVQVKGSMTQFSSKRILFTSPYPLLETFSRCDWLKDEELNQLSRRFPHQLHFEPGSITCYLTKTPVEGPIPENSAQKT